MQVKIQYPLSDDITATLSIRIDVGREMRSQAARLGYDPEGLENLIAQRTHEAVQQIAECLRLEYDPEPE